VALLTPAECDAILRSARRIAVLGIKPASRSERSAHNIPLYLHDVGYEILPVPVYYPDVEEIFSRRVYRSLRDVPGPIDVLNVFRRADHFPLHLDEVLAVRPPVVWFQSGTLHLPSVESLERAGIRVAHDCIGCRRASIAPSTHPLDGQRAI
jgi:predicted CoA-binding protein